MKKLFTLLGFLFLHTAHGQETPSFSFRYDAGATVRIGDRMLANPWAGGINSAQYSTIRLDADTVSDLAVFDRQTGKVLTFLAEKQTSGGYRWRHAPQYEDQFPALQYWMLLVDYDHDGRKDIFTYTNGGLRILQNTGTNGRLSWKTIADPVYHEGLSGILNLYINSTDLPAILDADDDGDIDILTYDINGSTVNLFQNMSVERKGDPNGLDFKRVGFCWGSFQSGNDCDQFNFGVDCNYTGGSIEALSNARVKHNGNSMLVIDADGDGKRDMLTAHITCLNLTLLPNTGGNGAATLFKSFQTGFPASNPIAFEIFPAVYSEDLDFDGIKDLVASPNTYTNDDYFIDFSASNWFYRNAGTAAKPNFQQVTKRFLQEDMIDLGEMAAPALADIDGDGDMDLFVGNAGVLNGSDYRARIAYFENVGSATKPAFELRSEDYLNLSKSFQLSALKPMFADVDGNGSLDFIFIGRSINRTPELRYILNPAARGAAFQLDAAKAQLLPTPDRLSILDRPTWYDVDKDGKTDLLIGKQTGPIEYHRNTGTSTAPRYELSVQNYGQINVVPGAGSPSIVVIDFNGDQRPELLTGTTDGVLKLYQLPADPSRSFQLLDSTLVINPLTQTSDQSFPGGNLSLTAADLDGDGLPELLAGTSTGGVRYLRNTSVKVVVTGVDDEAEAPWAFPNPTERFLRITSPAPALVEVLNLLGQPVQPRQAVQAQTETVLDLGSLPVGVYLVRLLRDGQPVRVRKVVVTK